MGTNKPVVIGIAGGSGSGKTSVTKAIFDHFKGHSILILEQDYYYKDQSHLPMEERLKTNYDHPLLAYKQVEKPVYDYTLHTRSDEIIPVEPKDVIILEGILILEDPRLCELMDIKLFVDTDADLRILRRMQRDIKERGRTMDSVIDQYVNVVRPMHNQFIEPSKKFADIIIPEGGQNHVAFDIMVTKFATILEQKVNL